jgi:hypothetical protein
MPRLLIIGGSDAGIAAALRAREVAPQLTVTVLVADAFPNYSICGLPFYLSGEVPDWHDLAHRTAADIERNGIELRLSTQAHAINQATRQVMATTLLDTHDTLGNARALWKYLHQYRPQLLNSEQEQHMFVGYCGIPLLRNGVSQLVQRIGERAGITGMRISPHTFRHTFARGWLENGGEIFKLSRVLGHSEMQTTQIYLRDFQSREARVDHSQYSPVERHRLGRIKRGKGQGQGKQHRSS